MDIDLNRIKRLSISDVDELEGFLQVHASTRSAFNVVNLMIWGTQVGAGWFIVEDRLIIYNEAWNCVLMPLGEYFKPEDMIEISDTFLQAGKCGTISFVDPEYIDMFRNELENYFTVTKDDNNADYVYLSEKLASLSGKKLQKKKNLVSQFKREFPDYIVRDLLAKDVEECITLSDKWVDDHHREQPGYVYEKRAIEIAFHNFDVLKLEGTVIQVNGTIIAFSVYTELKRDMAVIHFEKYDREIKGSAQVINMETAKALQQRYRYLNREEDLGIPGLRKAKQSYQPIMMLECYKLIKKNCCENEFQKEGKHKR
jgi:uncharacterized protein